VPHGVWCMPRLCVDWIALPACSHACIALTCLSCLAVLGHVSGAHHDRRANVALLLCMLQVLLVGNFAAEQLMGRPRFVHALVAMDLPCPRLVQPMPHAALTACLVYAGPVAAAPLTGLHSAVVTPPACGAGCADGAGGLKLP
jgi:hypothetical protein